MKALTIRSVLKKTPEGVLVVPASKTDKMNLESFTEVSENKYITINFTEVKGTKTYDQIKAAWALITILFESMYFRKPTELERKQLYEELLDEFADRRPSFLHPEETVPVSMSEMNKKQMSSFIQSLISLLAESCDLSEKDQLLVKDIFTEWQNYKSSLDKDPDDYDENGELLPLDIWRLKHPVSFASGIGGNLDLAHIVSRGADEIHRDCCWNTMMLTHEEHMLQHAKGWNYFLELYPHLRGRVERARRIAGKLALLEKENNLK